MFDTTKESFSEREERILQFWEEKKIFEKSLEQTQGKEVFSFYDGPPFATGLPHYGNLLAGTIKDVIPRYKTMQGFYVPRRFGWDCHGLPVENEIEKEKKLYGAKAIENYGIANFNDDCASIVLRYTSQWEKIVKRMGRWVDFSDAYLTMNKSFMESVWWVFKQLFDKGLVYKGYKVMPFSAKLGTPLSNFEANLNYKDVNDPSVTVAFSLEEDPNVFLLAWTTTPWTLISNLALTVGPDIDYVKIKEKKSEKFYIFAKSRLLHYFPEDDDYDIVQELKGKELYQKRYKPLFPYFSDRKDAFRILIDDFVTLEEGTGIVHTAPAFGEVDFYTCQKENIFPVCPVDNNGCFTKEISEYENLFVKDADKKIIQRLKEEKKLFHLGQIRHRYPFCWRSDTPLIYKAVDTWFVAVEKVKDRLLRANEKIHWVPAHIKEGRFGKWLENARDWAISRSRYWGTPIPIWESEDGDILVIGSVEELEELCGKKIDNLHRQYIDDFVIEKNGKKYRRIFDVFDCWFESGSMPYAQNHYPFENKEETEKTFPADFIAEGLDQTRGWFYTLTVIAAALFDKPAFKNVIVNGIILAENGYKMSKSLKNYPDPQILIGKYGADAIRLYMMNSPVVKAEDLRFSEKGVELVLRQVLLPLWNSYFFLSTYANIYKWKPEQEKLEKFSPVEVIDKWIISLSQKLINDVQHAMDKYELIHAVEPVISFIEQLTNWYIRRSRKRFWSEKDTQDRRDAFSTLYTVLMTLVKVVCPFTPYISDAIYGELKEEYDPESVHLCSYPSYSEEKRDIVLEMEMNYVQRAVAIGHSLRKEHKIKVRQPLPRAHIVAADPEILQFLEKQKHLIADELNVKDVHLHTDETKFVRCYVKPNFRILGKKVGKLMPQVQAVIKELDLEKIKKIQEGQNVSIEVEGQEIVLTSEDVSVERKVLEGIAAGNDEKIALALDLELSDMLLLEGLSREIVNKLNTMRKEKGFEVTDRIKVVMDTTIRVKECFDIFGEYISHEVLAVDVAFTKTLGTQWDLNGENTIIDISKA